jgi:hypothetical protein
LKTNRKHIKCYYSGNTDVKAEYKRISAVIRKEIKRRRRLSWEKFITQMEHNLHKPKPNTKTFEPRNYGNRRRPFLIA